MNIAILIIMFILTITAVIYQLYDKIYLPGLIQKIKKLMEEKKFQEARILINKLLQKKSEDVQLKWFKSQTEIEQGQYILAIVTLNDILKADVFNREINPATIHQQLADIYDKTGRHKEAMTEYYSIIQYEPDNFQANVNVAKNLLKSGKTGNAQNYLKRAHKIDGSKVEPPFLLGQIMQKTGEYRQAIAYYFTALKNDPSCEDAMYGLGECYIKLDDHSNAYDFFLKVRSLHGGMQRNAEVYIGLCLFKLGKYSEAAEYLETGLKGISEKLPLWNEGMAKLADSYIFCRDIGKVREIYQKILANHPSNSEIRHKETILTNFFNNKELIDFYNLDGDKFQQTVKKIFERLDFIIDSMGINSENSISLKISRIRKSSQRVTEFIFLDRTPRLVTVTVLEEEFEKMKASRAQIAFFITLFDFEDGCHQYVASKPLELINGAEFYKILKGYDPF